MESRITHHHPDGDRRVGRDLVNEVLSMYAKEGPEPTPRWEAQVLLRWKTKPWKRRTPSSTRPRRHPFQSSGLPIHLPDWLSKYRFSLAPADSMEAFYPRFGPVSGIFGRSQRPAVDSHFDRVFA